MALSARYSKATDTFDSSISADWENGGGDWVAFSWVTGGYVQPDVDAAALAAIRYNTTTPGQNQYSKVTINELNYASSYAGIGGAVRMASGTDESAYSGYLFDGGSNKYIIYETTSAFGISSIASGGTPDGPYSAGDYIILEISGTSLELYTKEGAGTETSRLTVSDGTLASPNNVYVGIAGQRSAAGDIATATSWEGGDDVSPGQYAYPNADVTDGGWYSNTGTQTNLYSFMDEASASDADFIETDISTTGQWTMTPITSVGSGTYILRYRAAGDASSNLIAYIGVGTPAGSFSSVQSFTEVGVSTAVTAFAHTVTGTFSDTTKLSIKFEAT